MTSNERISIEIGAFKMVSANKVLSYTSTGMYESHTCQYVVGGTRKRPVNKFVYCAINSRGQNGVQETEATDRFLAVFKRFQDLWLAFDGRDRDTLDDMGS